MRTVTRSCVCEERYQLTFDYRFLPDLYQMDNEEQTKKVSDSANYKPFNKKNAPRKNQSQLLLTRRCPGKMILRASQHSF